MDHWSTFHEVEGLEMRVRVRNLAAEIDHWGWVWMVEGEVLVDWG